MTYIGTAIDPERPIFENTHIIVTNTGTATAGAAPIVKNEGTRSGWPTISPGFQTIAIGAGQGVSTFDFTKSMMPWMAAAMIEQGMGSLQSDEELDEFQTALEDLIDRYGRDAIEALKQKLVGTDALEKEPLVWRFLRALGHKRAFVTNVNAVQILIEQLESEYGGRRSAAAAALSAFPGNDTVSALQKLKRKEKNDFVLAGLEASLRVLKDNGVSHT
jgi:HEAT repeat protein